MAYKQNAGRNNTPASSPIDMHGPLQQKRRIAMTGDIVDGEFKFNRTNKWVDDEKAPGWEKKVVDNPGYDVSKEARGYVHKIKKSNFFRPSDKIIFKVPKDKLDDEGSKLTTEPTKHWKKHKETINESTGKIEPAGWYIAGTGNGTHWTGGAPTPREQRRSNIKEKVKLGLTGLAGALGWHLTNTMGKGR